MRTFLRRRRGGASPRSVLSAHSVVGQMFLLQVVTVTLLVAAAVAALVLQARQEKTDSAYAVSRAVAGALAESPGTAEALSAPDPAAVLQPRAEDLRKRAGVTFVVVMDLDGVRYSHPNPDLVGERNMTADLTEVRAGRTVQDSSRGSLGRAYRVVVPVRDADDAVVGMVSAGVTVEHVDLMLSDEMPLLLVASLGAFVLTTGGAALLSRRLLRQTHGLGPAEITRMYERSDAVLRSVREGVLILDEKRRLVLANDEARRLLDLPPDGTGRPVTELALDPATAELLSATDRDVTDEVHRAGGRLLAVNHRRIPGPPGPPSTVTTVRDTTEMRALSGRAEAAQRRLSLLYAASVGIGTTLELYRTAEELTEVAVPDFADYVTVDLAAPVLRGEDAHGLTRLRRVAAGGVRSDHPLYSVDEPLTVRPDSAQVRDLRDGRAVLERDLAGSDWWRLGDSEHERRLLDFGLHSVVAAPLHARGVVLGLAAFWRGGERERFDSDDLTLAVELANRTAVCVDNARRYTREHDMAATLQRSLLPRGLPGQSAVTAAYRYRPAQAVGGDFFDVIPLSGARVALVVADVVGHGLHAAATMGRLRTAVHNFAALDLPPDELLGRLDELADRVDRDEAGTAGAGLVTGATCLYAVYDPVDGHCVMARAGHLPPALVGPDGTVVFPELPAQPPLGVGGTPFETTDLRLPEGTRIVLCTDGLIETRDRDIGTGLELLGAALAGAPAGPEEMCDAVLDAMLPDPPDDDVALLIARTRVLPPDRVSVWDLPTDPAAISGIRGAVGRKLAEWHLDDMAFVTELILTELISNALRHSSGPLRARLLRDRALICEVADGSSTSPHLRNAATTDEGGRGLFLVAQYADRWGTRYMPDGKVIWAEQRLPARYRPEP
ncbi:SpoIIE family protein phosphatase [Streptomyces sp. URMC 129]|uniref:SpoIIE family protein phosphatase n=1 Tax=Streptomyces sp. URMC 129 TaxID=3423407 RepID=UPI003F19803D